MKNDEQVLVSDSDFETIKKKYNCFDLSNEQVYDAMLSYQNTLENVSILEQLIYPTFGHHIDLVRKKSSSTTQTQQQ
jgi:hypothetical protein